MVNTCHIELDFEAFGDVENKAENDDREDVGDNYSAPRVDTLTFIVIFHWSPHSPEIRIAVYFGAHNSVLDR